jgi:prevent-host-death family protein
MSGEETTRPLDAMGGTVADVARTVAATATPVVLTENGEPSVVIQDIASYRETRDALALTQLVAVIDREVDSGETDAVEVAFAEIRRRAKEA